MPKLEYSLFPGCSGNATGISYTEATNYVAGKIGLELHEIDDWCCCGTSAAKLTDEDLMHALPARSLALSERQYPDLDVVAPCTGCYSSLKASVHWARQSEANRAHVSDLIDMDYAARADVKSMLEVMVDPEMRELIVSKLSSTLGGMKLACYYGCTQVRPAEVVNFENPENPTSMEELLNAAGAECVEWAYKTECCGASNHVVSPKAGRAASERILRNAKANGAEAIVTSCPLCWLNIDMREKQINKEFGTDYELPVYYFTQLLALAMGATPKEAGLQRHFTPAVDYATGRLMSLEEARALEEARRAEEAAAKRPKRPKPAKQPAKEVSGDE